MTPAPTAIKATTIPMIPASLKEDGAVRTLPAAPSEVAEPAAPEVAVPLLEVPLREVTAVEM
jgi:hypothetical protein